MAKKKDVLAGHAEKTKQESKTPDVPDVLKKPTAKQLVGGSSWTGKLPTALLHEFCQKQGWLKPDYNLSHRSGDYTVISTILSKKNPKNSEIESVGLRPSKEELTVLPSKSAAIEARNVAATWCLHRVGHKLNFSMQMPPDHRALWNKLELIRKEDIKNKKEFLYDVDPFRGAKQHAAEMQKWAKENEERSKEAQKKVVIDGHVVSPWKNVPQVEMSKDVRQQIEIAIRSLQLQTSSPAPSHARLHMVSQLTEMGFRPLHAEEACDHSETLELALEFLLLFTPEDDLPHRFLPPAYSTGLSGSSHDTESLQLDYAAKRLHIAGYGLDICRQTMKIHRNEDLAMEILQAGLLQVKVVSVPCYLEQTEWKEEVESLQAIYGDTFKSSTGTSEVSLSLPLCAEYRLHLRPPASGLYPTVLPTFYISSEKPLPAYIRLALIKELGEFAKSLGTEPMVFLILEHLDDIINRIIANPGKLLDLAGSVVGHAAEDPLKHQKKDAKRRRRPIEWTVNTVRSVAIKESRKALMRDAKHIKKMEARYRLPAAKKRDEIIQILDTEQCLIISGETGSGKSTQVVQYVLDHMIDSGLGDVCNIICTQPRRISALGLADRVGDERSNPDQVGYAIRGDSKQGPETKIQFVTTGVLLRRLTVNGDAGLDGVTHVFVDEVHERSIDSDFLLISLRDLMKRRSDLKVILMSATVEADLFCKYLSAKHLHIEGRTFPVVDYYLDDMSFLHRGSEREKSKNGVDYDIIASIVEHIDQDLGDDPGGILIFLPGTFEIGRTLQEIDRRSGGRYNTLPLHASLPPSQQRKVFLKSSKRKVIASTNVAETSITIDDIVAVIDTGRVKQMNYDANAGVIKFEEVWCSKAACKQRRGRAGRVQAGRCYKTYTRALESAKMAENTPPEIIRTPLEQVALSALAMNKDGRKFLNQAVTVPDQRALDSAIALLKSVGAVDANEKLTTLGQLLATIPADLKVSKLLILASIFGQLDRALVVGSCLSSRSPFFPGPDSATYKAKFAGRDGDVLAETRAFEEWSTLNGRERRSWCDENHISDTTMQEIRSTITQYRDALRETGLIRSTTTSLQTASQDDQSDELIKALLASALAPNIARIQFPDVKYSQTIGGALAKDHDSKTIKFYTSQQRIFIHPSSPLFSENEYKNAPFLSFFQGTMTSKFFIRGVTPVSMYGHLLLGPSLQLDSAGRGLITDSWIRIAAWPKIAVFVNLMRNVIDRVMARSIDYPGAALTTEESVVIELMKRLVSKHGL